MLIFMLFSLHKSGIKKNNKDAYLVDLAKGWSTGAPYCLAATPCVVPNSLPYRLKETAVLSPMQLCCVQGIWQKDFPALSWYAKEKRCLTRDLAGNAFSSTVCMAVVIACLTHAPSLTVQVPSTSPASSSAEKRGEKHPASSSAEPVAPIARGT